MEAPPEHARSSFPAITAPKGELSLWAASPMCGKVGFVPGDGATVPRNTPFPASIP